MLRMMQTMTISVCTASSSGEVQYCVITPDSHSRMGLHSHMSDHGAGHAPVLGFRQRLGAAHQRVALVRRNIHPRTRRGLSGRHDGRSLVGAGAAIRRLDAGSAERLERLTNFLGAHVIDPM